MKIVGLPVEFKGFFNRFRDLMTVRQFHYFAIYVYSLIVLEPEQKSVSGISKAWVEPICRSSLERFISGLHFDFSKLTRRARRQIMRRLSNAKRKDRYVQLVLDDTTLLKFGRKVFGVGWYRKNKYDPALLGLQVVVIGILVEGWLVPIDFRIYVQEQECERMKLRFETKLEQAADMLRNLDLPREYSVEVMFDAWYLNGQVTRVIEQRRWTWLSRCASNRKVLLDGEDKAVRLQESASMAKWLPLKYKSDRKHPAVVGHQRMGQLKGIGRVKVVMSSLVPDGSRKIAFFCTNSACLPMVAIIERYERRWKIEVFFKEARNCFALGRWEMRDVVSVVHHLCLVIVAAIACACIRMDELGSGKAHPNESWGAFTRRCQNANKRRFLKDFLKRFHSTKDCDFDVLCDAIAL